MGDQPMHLLSADTWPEWRPGMASGDRRILGEPVEGGVMCAQGEWHDFVPLGDLDPPDTDDPATVGCIHAQAEEAWGCEVRTYRLSADPERWSAVAVALTAEEHRRMPDPRAAWFGPTRGEALLACWRAAQGRAL